jgi:hypothetical protein
MKANSAEGTMRIHHRLWLNCDPGALAVLVIGIFSVAALALTI